MPVIGTISRVPHARPMIWVICPACQEERWAQYRRESSSSSSERFCLPCNRRQAKRGFQLHPERG